MTKFSDIKKGRVFTYNGQLWLKRSTRTANLLNEAGTNKPAYNPSRSGKGLGHRDLVTTYSTFYFGMSDPCYNYYSYKTVTIEFKVGLIITIDSVSA